MTTFSTLRDALDALPHGPELIADHLNAIGVRGSCNEPGRCAIAEYLTAVLDVPGGHSVRVSNNAASVRRLTALSARALELCWFRPVGTTGADTVDRPDICEFISNFDRGQYPDLIGTAATAAA